MKFWGEFALISLCIIFKKRHMTNSGNVIEVEFSINIDTLKTKAKVINPNKCYGAIKEGSVMLIRYAKEDPKVVEILACHYKERKHKHLIGLNYSDELEIEE